MSYGKIFPLGGSGGSTPSGIAGAIQFSNGSAFASDAANLFWDDTNNRLGVGTNAPATALDIQGADNTFLARFGTVSGDVKIKPFLNATYGSYVESRYANGTFMPLSIGASRLFAFTPVSIGTDSTSAMLQVQGSGSTSATTSLLVQNSAGTNWLQVKDDGDITNGANGSTELKFEISPVANKFFRLTRQSTNVDFYAGSGGNAAIETSGGAPFSLIASSAYLTLSNGGVSIGATLNTTNASAILDVTSTTKGFLPPRMTTTQKNAIASPASGLVVYDSTTNKLCCYNGSTWNDLF